MKRIILPSLLSIALSITATLSLSAQTGPGGVGNSSNNILWLDASTLNLNNGDPVSIWPDISGNGNNAFQIDTTKQATYLKNSLNNKPNIIFDGVNDYFELSNHIISSENSIFIVFNSTSGGKRPLLSTNKHLTWGRNINAFISYNTTFKLSKHNAASIFSIHSDQNTASTFKMTADNNTSNFNRTSLRNTPKSSIGTLFNTLSTNLYYHDGSIAEIIMYNERLNTVSQNIIFSALSAKYNLPAPTSLYNHKSVYNNNIIGIGQESSVNQLSARGRDSLLISNPSNLNDGEYLLVGNNGADFTTSNAVPNGIVERWEKVWRTDKTGAPGTVELEFFVGANDFSAPGSYVIIIENDDGDFTNGGVTVHDAGRFYDPSKLSVKFTNVDLPDGAYFTLAERTSILTSTGNGNWNDPTVWSCECVPNMNDLVVSDDTISISNNQSALDIQINSGGLITFTGSDTLFVYGDMEINGEIDAGTGTIAALKTNDAQYFANNSSNKISFYNLYVNNDEGLELNNGGWELSNNLQVSSGGLDVTNADSIVLISNASKTAQILPSMTDAFTGDFVVQRFISTRDAGYGNLSSPITNATVADLDDDLFLSGVNGNNGNITFGGNVFYSVFKYNYINDTHDTITSVNESISPGTGVEVYLATTGSTFIGQTIDYIGTPTSGDINAPIDQGWNLVGNPYYSHIAYDSIDKNTNVPSSYYIWNANNASYDFITGSSKPLIPAGQGFWVEKIFFGGTNLRMDENTKISSYASTFYRKKQVDPYFNLNISNNHNSFEHKMRLVFDVFATAEMDERDARHLPSPIKEAPAIYSKALNSADELIMNSLNPTEESQLVPVSIYAGVEGKYEINADNIDALYENYSCVYIKDKETEEAIDLMVEPNYSFEAKQGKSDRFHLILSNSYEECQQMIENGSFTQKLDTKVNLRNAYDNWYLDYTLGEAQTQLEIRVYNMSGQEVKAPMSFEAHGAGTYPLQHLNDLEGIYLIQVIGKDVFLNKQVKL